MFDRNFILKVRIIDVKFFLFNWNSCLFILPLFFSREIFGEIKKILLPIQHRICSTFAAKSTILLQCYSSVVATLCCRDCIFLFHSFFFRIEWRNYTLLWKIPDIWPDNCPIEYPIEYHSFRISNIWYAAILRFGTSLFKNYSECDISRFLICILQSGRWHIFHLYYRFKTVISYIQQRKQLCNCCKIFQYDWFIHLHLRIFT